MSDLLNLTEFVLRPGGEIIRRTLTEHQVDVPDNLLAAINKDVSIALSGLVEITDWGWLGMTVTGGKIHYCTVPVRRIILRTGFDLVDKDKKIFAPNFASSDPQMEMVWKVPGDMQVLILMMVQRHKDLDYAIPKSFLFAMDERGNYWKLPLSNVYEDGAICEGREIGRFPTMLAAVMDMLQTFDRSRWNRDLWREQDESRQMFRFQAVEGGKYEPMALPVKNWTKLCKKIAIDAQKFIVL